METKLKYSEKVAFVFFQLFVMFFPVKFNVFKLGMIVLLICFMFFFNRKVEIPKLYIYCIIYVIFNIVSILWGVINAAPGALKTYTVDIIYPLVFPILYYYYCKRGGFWLVSKVILWGGTLVACYDILYVLSELGIIPFFDKLHIDELSLAFDIYGLRTHFTSTHLNTLFFSFPLTVVFVLMKDKYEIEIKKNFLIVSFLLQLICIVLATRAALLVVACLSPVLGIIINFIVCKKIKFCLSINKFIKNVMVTGIVLFVIYKFRNQLLDIWGFLFDKILFESNVTSTAERVLSKNALLEGWLNSPILGYGTGSFTSSVIRSEKPWEYEVTYYALLFQKGIIGFVSTFLLYAVIIINTIKNARRQTEYYSIGVALCTSYILFLIANAYDPYLSKFGYMWVIFIPFSFACGGVFRRFPNGG